MKQDGMLASLMRKLGGTVETVEASTPESIVALQAEFDAFKADAEAQHTELASALETAVNAVKEADTRVAEMQAELASFQATAEAAAAKAEEARLSARKQKIEAAVGSEKADALMVATNGLDDTAFNAVLSAMTLATDKEAKSTMFTEQGAAAEVDAGKVVTESAEMKILRARYPDAA